jgi:hypothetical protein
MYDDNKTYKEDDNDNNNSSCTSSNKNRLHSRYGDVIMTMATTVRKHIQARRAAAKLVLLFLIVTSLIVPVMLSSLPLAAAVDVVADCKNSGGTWVVNARGEGNCVVELPSDCFKLSREDVPDPELCLKSGGVSTDPTPSACSTTEGGTNTAAGRPAAAGEGTPLTTSELEMQIQEACIALQTGDTQGAMMNLDLALNALGSSIGDNGTQVANITNTTTTASGATNATSTTNATTGTNATQEVDQPINSTAIEMDGPGSPIKDIPMAVTETPTEEEAAGGGNNPSTTTTTTTTTDGDDTGTTDTGTTAAQPPADSAQEGDPIPDCAPQDC